MTDAETQLVHIIDDTERKRTSAVRTMGNARDLLTDALAAIEDENLHTGHELVDRALDAITKELANQRGE